MEAKRWLETGDIAAELGMHRETIAKYLDTGRIPLKVVRFGERGHRRVLESEYRAWLESGDGEDDQRAA